MREPVESLSLFPALNAKLIAVLKSLSAADWQRQTVARKWVVKDVAAHLLDGNFRRIALHRDGWTAPPDSPIHSYQDLLDFLNRLNADWVQASKRLSPALIIELLESTNTTVLELFKKLDPQGTAVYAVGWAGEEVSSNWFDIAREYTERWLHQQQIRDAIGDNGIRTAELYQPFLHIFLQAWPFTMRHNPAAEGSFLKLQITGPGGGEWWLLSKGGQWELMQEEPGGIQVAATKLDGDFAWKLFSKSRRKEDGPGMFEVVGNQELGLKVLDMVSVMA